MRAEALIFPAKHSTLLSWSTGSRKLALQLLLLVSRQVLYTIYEV